MLNKKATNIDILLACHAIFSTRKDCVTNQNNAKALELA